MDEENGASDRSPDAEAIARLVARHRQFDEWLEREAERSGAFDNAVVFDRKVRWIAMAMDNPRSVRARWRALRALVEWVGKHNAKYLVHLAQPMADADLMLVLRAREEKERKGAGAPDKQLSRQIKRAKLLRAEMRYRGQGLSVTEARRIALADMEMTSTGLAGAAKLLTTARVEAKARGFIDPLAPLLVQYFGADVEPDVRISDIPPLGRPKKGEK